MPELRSGARRSKRLDDIQTLQQPISPAENWTQPPQNKTRRRVGGRGRGGNATGVAKGASPAIPTRPTAAGRGQGIRLIDLDPEPCEVEPAALGAAELGYNRVVVADKDIAMEGGSADKALELKKKEALLQFQRGFKWIILLYIKQKGS